MDYTEAREKDSQSQPSLGRPSIALPPKVHLLWVSSAEPSWINLALTLDREGCQEPAFDWVASASQALTAIRDRHLDVVVVAHGQANTEPAAVRVDLAAVQVLRTGGYDEPVILVAPYLDEDYWSEACRLDCEVVIAPAPAESSALAPMIVRSIRRAELSRENQRLCVADRRRLSRERDEAEHLLRQQRQMIHELHRETHLPPELNDYYHELLRTYVIMGSGSLTAEIGKLGEMVAAAGFSPREALDLHLERVETLVHGLGNRSARHVMARADLLALELMMALGEHYHRRFAE